MDEKLIGFVDHARDQGLDHATIRQLLLSAGWNDKDIAEVLCARDLELSIPRPPVSQLPGGGLARTSGPRRPRSIWPRRARDGFLHLLAYGALYTWSISLFLLLTICINFAFPDPAWRMSHSRLVETLSVVRIQLAILVVSFPVFLVTWHFLLREVRRDPEKARGGIRRWLGYMSLFVSAVSLSLETITLIYLLLEGQLQVRFVLQAAALFVIAGGLIVYLAYTLRIEAKMETEA